MNRTTALSACCVLAAALASGADWVYDNGTFSDGVWTFNAQLSGTKVTLTAFTLGPSTVTELDFTKPIKDASGNPLTITYFGRLFESFPPPAIPESAAMRSASAPTRPARFRSRLS